VRSARLTVTRRRKVAIARVRRTAALSRRAAEPAKSRSASSLSAATTRPNTASDVMIRSWLSTNVGSLPALVAMTSVPRMRRSRGSISSCVEAV
jgi:peptidoglycan hydrolase-like amidase